MSRFPFFADHNAAFEVKRLCELVEIERSSYYAWVKAAPAREARAAADAELAEKIRAIHADDNTIGAPRATAELNDGVGVEERVNHKRVARVMREHGIAGYQKKRRVRTTIPEPSGQVVPDLLKRDFTAPAPGLRYVGDITYLPIADGTNLYLATVIDCFSRRLVGWSVPGAARPPGWPGRSFTATTGRSTRPRTTPGCVPTSASPSPWVRWARAQTMPSPSRSTRR